MERTGDGSLTEPFAVSRVTADTLDYVWSQILPMIRRALRHGSGDSITEEQVLAQLRGGDLILWAIHEGGEIIAGLALSVHRYPAKTALIVEFAAGRDFHRWAKQVQTLLREFKELIGADTLEASCRFGLARKLERLGWTRKAIIMELK